MVRYPNVTDKFGHSSHAGLRAMYTPAFHSAGRRKQPAEHANPYCAYSVCAGRGGSSSPARFATRTRQEKQAPHKNSNPASIGLKTDNKHQKSVPTHSFPVDTDGIYCFSIYMEI